MTDTNHLFVPIKNLRTFDEVSTKIKDLIFTGVLKPGDRLPSEVKLAQQLNVGRQSIREALRLLEISGFINIQRGGGGGPVIKDTIIKTISDLFLDAFRLKKISLIELTTARLEIEKIILKQVFKNVEESDIHALKDNIKKARQRIQGNEMAMAENIQFHKLLAKASKNHVYFMVMESIMAVVRDFLSRLAADINTSSNVVGYHERIVEAIIDQKEDVALRVLEEHLLETQSRLQTLMDQVNGG